MRNVALLATRVVLGGYLIAHGSQKMFGALDGPGLDKAGAGFESMGLKPGRQMATLAAASELAGGALTVAGLANPVGPVLIGSAMITASAVHRPAGPMGAKGGYEQTLTNLAIAATLAASGPGKYKVGPGLPARLAVAFTAGATAVAAYTASRVVKGQMAVQAKPNDEHSTDEATETLAENEAVVDVARESSAAQA